MANKTDLAFTPPGGSDPDEIRAAFDQIDNRIRRAFAAVDELNQQLADLVARLTDEGVL